MSDKVIIKKSIQYYLSFIETSQTPIDYSNLSLALWLDQQPEKALYYAQKALELALIITV